MKRSDALAPLVPAAVATVTSTVPAPGGDVAVIWFRLLTVKPVAAAEPNETPVTLMKLVPVTTTEVPPAVVPALGATPVTVGGG